MIDKLEPLVYKKEDNTKKENKKYIFQNFYHKDHFSQIVYYTTKNKSH